MGLFNGPWLNKEEHERSIHLNLIGQVNMLNLHNYELQAKLEMAQGRIEELEQEIDNYETTYKGSVVEAQAKRIEELEAALKPFAKAANYHSENTPNYREAEAYFTLGQLRAARKVLGDKSD
jgi:predicted RNase H-like nuclease (RuvC/YqgF family)